MTRALRLVACAASSLLSLVMPAYAEVPSGAAVLTYEAIKGGAGASRWLAITALDVGQGNCILVSCPNGDQVIYDCGSSAFYDRDRINSFFQSAISGRALRSIVISHGDDDHVDKVSEILIAARVNQVENFLYGGEKNDNITTAIATARIATGHPINVFGKAQGDSAIVLDGPRPELGCQSGAQTNGASILAANVGIGNDASIVVRLLYGNFSILFTGDGERKTDRAILNAYPAGIRTTAVVVTHHGSQNRTNLPELLTALSPRVGIYSAGNLPGSYAHPRCVTAALFEKMPLLSAPAHRLTCYHRRNDPEPDPNDPNYLNYTEALYSTHDSGSVILFSDGVRFSLWTCPRPLSLTTCRETLTPRSVN